MTVAADYATAKTALNSLVTSGKAAQDLDNNTALESATLAACVTAAEHALAALEGSMADERTGNLLTTLGL